MTTPSGIRKLNPEQMTPQERLERLIELLALGVIRATKDKETSAVINAGARLSSTKPVGPFKKKGRIPFGQSKAESGRRTNSSEEYWIAQIIRLSAEGFSSEQIARQLNQDDTLSRRAGQWSRTGVWRILKRFKEKDVTK